MDIGDNLGFVLLAAVIALYWLGSKAVEAVRDVRIAKYKADVRRDEDKASQWVPRFDKQSPTTDS